MGTKADRTPVAEAQPFVVVPAVADEAPDYWLLHEGSDPFPINLDELHDLMDVIDAVHDEVHPH